MATTKTKKKASPAQIAARKRFAEMARSGAFKRKAVKANRRKNGTLLSDPPPVKKRRKRNPIRLSESEARRYAPKIKGLSVGPALRAPATRKKGKARKFKKAPKNALARLFSGSGPFGLGRSRKTIRARNPHGQHLPGLPAKYQRMYEDILASSGSKRIAAATARKAFEKANPRRRNFSLKPKVKRVTGKGHRGTGSMFVSARTDWGMRRKTRRAQRKISKLFNPSPDKVFSEFRGKGATTKTKVNAAKGTPGTLAKLGQLRELHVGTKKLSFGGNAALAADGRKKLHLVGVKMKQPNPPGEIDYGEIKSVTYRADKPHIEQGTYDYVHHFGEEGGRCPHLIVDEEGYPVIEGGSYRINADGIID